MIDLVLSNCHVATMVGAVPYGAIRDAAIGIAGGKIAWVGPRADAPNAMVTSDLGGAWVTPGLIDCHTHLVFGDNRAPEWEARLNGATYEEIAKKGGGITSTVKATRAASDDDLIKSAQSRLDAMTAHGTTTVEVKSGYGLDLDSEKKMLRAAADLNGARIVRTFLGAHAVPPEFANDREMYVDLICDTMIPVIAREKLADAVDAFCETIGFTHAETMRVFEAAKKHGLPVKLHAEQLSDMDGASLACRYNALSVDHLEHLSDEGIAAMKASGTVAVLLPCAYYFLRDTKLPPVEKLRAANIPMAVATDCNPGTSPCTSPLLAMNMACTLFRLTPEESLRGMTANAARALGIAGQTGTIEVGKSADLAVWNIGDPSELAYWMGADLLLTRYLAGEEQ